MRPHPRRAETNPTNPRAWATCQRCGFIANHYKLRFQYEWAGTELVNEQILVCETCYDQPQRQLGTIILPPDPVPIMSARPEQYAIEEQPVTTLSDTDGRILIVAGVPQGQGAANVIEIIVATAGNLSAEDRSGVR